MNRFPRNPLDRALNAPVAPGRRRLLAGCGESL